MASADELARTLSSLKSCKEHISGSLLFVANKLLYKHNVVLIENYASKSRKICET